ncbi:hypothetical protein CKF54_02735 [Psittacicella hinzii]|uniref:Protoporphyrinogen IX dehydrogenase [quinone] n=1 Tax=Psittacicella hinzii TaxID=2028575 RepID=A0A3A1Y5J5_9GAMM|nr:menaquinone-dependent protoporphyrinogen IX dehydrogenase [Psittacicella hinzii]RIY33542.1 hypothetical protein CKF54_02735 [Psittacicella hinzii]
MKRILLISGSREGHTHKINEFIGQQLGQVEIDHLSLNQAYNSQLDLSPYHAIVIGASIHYGYFPKELYSFIAKHLQKLQEIPSYFFGVCLTARKENKRSIENNLYMQKFLQKSPWQPKEAAVFAGALNYSILSFWDRNIIRFIMLLTKGDTDPKTNKVYTDWQDVTAFAKKIKDNF